MPNGILEGTMKSFKRSCIYTLTSVLLVITFFISKIEVTAASASVYFETEKASPIVGNTISIYLCVDTNGTLGDFEGFISYDADMLEYVGGASCITGGDGVLKVYDFGTSSTNTRKYLLTFKVLEVGYVELSVRDSIAYEYESGDAMSLSSTPLKMNTTAPESASDNAWLESLKISPGTLTPSFDPEVYVYNTSVDATTEHLILSALAQDLDAKVNISGNQNLKTGSNEVVVSVTAKAGNKKEYMIFVEKEDIPKEDENTSDIDEDKDTLNKEWRFEATKDDGIIQIHGQYYYTVVSKSDSIEIPKGYTKSSFVLNGITIPAYQKDGEVESDYLLLLLSNEAGDTGLYRYDRVEKTIQRYPEEKITIAKPSDDAYELAQLKELVKDYKEDLSQLGLVIALLIALSGVLLIGFIYFYVKSKGMHVDELD